MVHQTRPSRADSSHAPLLRAATTAAAVRAASTRLCAAPRLNLARSSPARRGRALLLLCSVGRPRSAMAAAADASPVLRVQPLGFPFATPDPFLFCVYHNDNFPQGNTENMFAPRRGNGADFDWSQPYRMYHGDRVPGFPQHPHRGFETLTLVQEGTVDHTDSLGAAGRYGGDGHAGDLQWMTAGSGCVHGENFPLVHSTKPNTMRLFQIWLNLPPESKMAPPTYVMRWAEEMRFLAGSGGAECEVAVGTLGGVAAGGASPPPDSWGADPAHDVGVFLATLPPGGALTLPPAAASAANRMAYIVEGPTDSARAAKVTVGGAPAPRGRAAFTLRADAACELRNDNSDGEDAQVLVLQGVPITAPVAQRGPFVMNTQEELAQAFEDYRRTQFGGWPWKEDAVVFARDQARFADIVAADGTKTRVVPPARVADKAEL